MKIQWKNKGDKKWKRHRGLLDTVWLLWLSAEHGRSIRFSDSKGFTTWRHK